MKFSNTLKNKIEKLPDSAKLELISFIDSLLVQHQNAKHRHAFTFPWEGGLSSEKSSVELQHKANEWRTENSHTRHTKN